MPTPLSCKSASALDSLPRHSNVKRSSSALNRLQQRRQGQQQQQQQGAEFGRLTASTSSADAQSPRAGLSKAAARKRPGQSKASQGLASSDLPLASSDLSSPAVSPRAWQGRDAFSDGEQDAFSDDDGDGDEQSIRVVGGMVRARSVSPTKVMRPMVIQDVDSGPSSPVQPSSSPSRRYGAAMPARKRVVTKAMIGQPTNFQHTGHIGASSYGALQKGGDADQLRQQLSEVAAALKLDDDIPDPARKADKASESSSLVPASEASPKKQDNGLPEPRQVSTASSPPASPAKADEMPLRRTTSKRKPVPAPRNLATLYGEFSEHAAEGEEEEETAEPERAPFLRHEPSVEQAEEESTTQPLPTIRAQNGKRLVQGPAGKYITDTANGRWNSALDEITKALRSDGQDDDDEEEELQDGLRRADAVLGRLDAL